MAKWQLERRAESVGTLASAAASVPKFSKKTQAKIPDHKVGGFALGDRVGHPSFGEGVILNYEGDGSNARVQVNFDTEGTKWLVLSFAKLDKIS